MSDETTIRGFQRTLPWGAHDYNHLFNARIDPQRDAAHALLHVHKAGGKLAGLVDGFDHDPAPLYHGDETRDDASKYLADLLICAARIANTWPGGAIDLEAALARRMAEKFPTKGE